MLRSVAYSFLGRTGLKVSNICLGSMTFGEDKAGRPFATEEETCKILDRYVELGGNFIDTADTYTGGKSEEIIGRWLAKQERGRLVVATKCGRVSDPGYPNGEGASRMHIMASIEASLKRLQTSYVDIFYVHVHDTYTPIEETLAALNDLVRAGKTRYIGLSNMKGWQVQKYAEVVKRYNYPCIVALQQQYSLLARSSEWEAVEVCENEGIGVLPWSPLKGGWLSGRLKRESGPPADSRIAWSSEGEKRSHHSHPDWKWFSDNDHAWKVLDTCEEIAKEQGRSVPQLAIRWLLQKPWVPSVVIGARTIEQLEGCMGAGAGWELTEQQMSRLDEVSSIPAPYPYDYIPWANASRGNTQY